VIDTDEISGARSLDPKLVLMISRRMTRWIWSRYLPDDLDMKMYSSCPSGPLPACPPSDTSTDKEQLVYIAYAFGRYGHLYILA